MYASIQLSDCAELSRILNRVYLVVTPNKEERQIKSFAGVCFFFLNKKKINKTWSKTLIQALMKAHFY